MALGVAVWGIAFLAIALAPQLGVAIAGLVGIGIGNSVADVAGYTLVGRWARDDALARVYGLHEVIRALAITAGAGASALVAAVVSARASLLAAGAVLVAGGLAALLRRPAMAGEPPAESLRLLRSNPIFGWLAPVGLERIATTLEPVELAAGAILLFQGEPGDRAYLVAEGELSAELETATRSAASARATSSARSHCSETPRATRRFARSPRPGCLRSSGTSSSRRRREARPRARPPSSSSSAGSRWRLRTATDKSTFEVD